MTATTPDAVSRWDGDPTTCDWCGEDEATLCVDGVPVCADCRTIDYERGLLRQIATLSTRVAALERELDEARAGRGED